MDGERQTTGAEPMNPRREGIETTPEKTNKQTNKRFGIK